MTSLILSRASQICILNGNTLFQAFLTQKIGLFKGYWEQNGCSEDSCSRQAASGVGPALRVILAFVGGGLQMAKSIRTALNISIWIILNTERAGITCCVAYEHTNKECREVSRARLTQRNWIECLP